MIMMESNATNEFVPKKLPLNIAIVGGGKACKFFLEFLKNEPFPFLNIKLLGVCDIEPQAEGLLMAKEMGIYTTNNFRDLFKIKNLDSIIELTDSREILLDLIKLRPKRVGIVEHNIGRLLRSLFTINQRLKSAEHQVMLEKMSSDFLIQQSNAAIVVLNTDFTIAEANEAYLKIVNKSKEEVVGAYCYELFYRLSAPCSAARPVLKCPMVETLRTGKSAHVIHEAPFSKDHASYRNIVTYPLVDKSGEIIRIIEILTDITDEISPRWEKRIEELKADLNKIVQEDRMISLGKLAASCVHEINNPIQGLLTFSHLMKETLAEGMPSSEDLEKFKKFLSLMSNELERCGNIISGLLSFSHQSTTGFNDVDLNDILKEVITLTSHKMELQNIYLNTEFSTRPLSIQGDVNHLQQCFLNLIFNAIEAMPQGGQLTIISKLDSAQKRARIEIQDSGYGIAEEDFDHIFDPFFTTRENDEGTGLGLSIVYGIVKNHGGNIKVNSQVKKGSSFILNFPTITSGRIRGRNA